MGEVWSIGQQDLEMGGLACRKGTEEFEERINWRSG